MAVGKSSLTRVAHATVIPAPAEETEKIIAKAATAATQTPTVEKKPVKKPTVSKKPVVEQNPSNPSYAVGDPLPIWLL